MTNAYDAWKAAKAALAGREIAEGLRSALELSVAALREPAKLAVAEGLLSTYGHFEHAELAQEIIAALSEFDESGPSVDEIAERVDNSLRAMKHLNYTGEHTHFEVLDDVRTVLAEVLQGRAIPLLERFRCPSLLQIASNPDDPVQTVRCALQLPHECKHVAELGQTWDDLGSTNPPKPYDEPAVCGSRAYQFTCDRPAGHHGSHSQGSTSWSPGQELFVAKEDS